MDPQLAQKISQALEYDVKKSPSSKSVLELNNSYVVQFRTLKGTHLYAVVNPKYQTVKDLIYAFYQNYNCQNIPDKDIRFRVFSSNKPKDKIYLNDFDPTTKLGDLNFQKNRILEIHLCTSPPATSSEDPAIILDQEAQLEKLHRKINSGQTFQIFVRGNHQLYVFSVVHNMTLYDLKLLVWKKVGINVQLQRLVYGGRWIDDDDFLGDIIQPECTVHLVYTLRGGMYTETSGRNSNYKPLKSCIFIVQNQVDTSESD